MSVNIRSEDRRCVGDPSEGTRFSTGIRVDLMDADFLLEIGKIMHVGAVKYGEFNWRKGLNGEKGGVNHALQHLAEYMADKPCNYGHRETHLAQVAVNVMFEFHFERNRRLANEAAEAEMNARAQAKDNLEARLAVEYKGLSNEERRRLNKAIGVAKKKK